MCYAIPIPFSFGEVGDSDSLLATQMTSTISTHSNSNMFKGFALRGWLQQGQILFISVHINDLNYYVSNSSPSVNRHVTQFHGLPVDHGLEITYINRQQSIL